MTRMERLGMLLVVAAFLPAGQSFVVQGRPNNPWIRQFDLNRYIDEIPGRNPYWPWFEYEELLEPDIENILSALPIFKPLPFPRSSKSLLKPPETSWKIVPSQGGISSSSAILTGPGTISGSSSPDGSFVTGTGNWNAVSPLLPLQGTAPNITSRNRTTSSVAFFPSQEGVSSSHAILNGPGMISGPSGPNGSFVEGTGNWNAYSPLRPNKVTSGKKRLFRPSQEGISSSKSVLKGTGSISGYRGPKGSLVTGTGDWQALPSQFGSTDIKELKKDSVEGLSLPMGYSNALNSFPALSPKYVPYRTMMNHPYNNKVQTAPYYQVYMI